MLVNYSYLWKCELLQRGLDQICFHTHPDTDLTDFLVALYFTVHVLTV